jgi:exonuclease VII large subunit
MNTFTTWTRVEENILKEFYGRSEYTMDRLQELLPNRSAGAIQNRAKALGLLDPAKRLLQEAKQAAQCGAGIGNSFLGIAPHKTMTIERLETELTERKLALEIETAEKQLEIFEQNAIRNKREFNEAIVKERARLTSRVSQLKLRLFKARLENA